MVPAFETRRRRPDGSAELVWLLRAKVTAVDVDGNTGLLKCVAISGSSGAIVGQKAYIVEKTADHLVGDLIYIMRPIGGTNSTDGGKHVLWAEVGGAGGSELPPATYEGAALIVQADKVWGVDYLRAAPNVP